MTIKIPEESPQNFNALREGIARLIKALDTGAVVYSDWALQSNSNETINDLTDETGKIHAWLVSIESVTPLEPKTGSGLNVWELELKIWGFVGYGINVDSNGFTRQALLEKECKDISKIIYLNRDNLGMVDDTPIKSFPSRNVVFSDIDVKTFGSGNDVLIAQGSLTVGWSETIREI